MSVEYILCPCVPPIFSTATFFLSADGDFSYKLKTYAKYYVNIMRSHCLGEKWCKCYVGSFLIHDNFINNMIVRIKQLVFIKGAPFSLS